MKRLVLLVMIASCTTETTQIVPDSEARTNNPGNPNPGTPSVGLQTMEAGSLIIPMDLSYQATGMFQSYGLLYQLLRQDVDVLWMIDPSKTWHATPCNTPGNTCAWDCG